MPTGMGLVKDKLMRLQMDKQDSFFFLLFICAYNVWVISSPFLLPLPFLPNPSLSPPTLLAARQKLFCPYLEFC
jgi:hypothetical protein